MNQQQIRRQQLLEELYNQKLMQGYQNDKNSYLDNAKNAYANFKKYKGIYNNALNSGNRIASLGQNMSNFGTKLQTSSNPYLNQIGNKIGNFGTNTTNFGNNIQTGINNLRGIGSTGTASTAPTTTSTLGANTALGTTGAGTTGAATTGTGAATTGTALGTTGATTATGAGTLGTTAGTAGTFGATAGTTAAGTAAGTGATLGATGAGATAAGTGAGLGAGMGAAGGGAAAAGAGAAAAVPVAGWALLAAAAIYSMLNSARQKKNAKAMQQGMQQNTKAEQLANEQTQQALQNNAQTQQETDQELAQQLQSTGMNGLTGMQSNQSEMTQNGQDMMAQIAQQLNIQGNNGEDEQNGNKLLQSSTSILPPAIKGTPMDMLNNQISKYTGLGNNSFSIGDLLQNPFSSNNSGNNTQTNIPSINMSQDSQDRYGKVLASGGHTFVPIKDNDGNQLTHEQLMTLYERGKQLNQMQGQPTGAGININNQQSIPAQAIGGQIQQQPNQLQGGISQSSPAFGQQVYQTGGGTGKIADLIDQFRQGYKDNTKNTIGNTYFAPGQQKTLANRLGEFVGTGQRIASAPLVQGLIAGGTDYAMGNNLGKSLLTGVDWAKNKAVSDRYEQAINGDNGRSFLGGYTAQDYNAKLAKDYKDQQQANWQAQQNYKQQKDEQDFNYKKEKDTRDYNEKVRHNKESENISKTRIQQYAKQHGISQKQAEEKLKLQREKFEWEKTHPKGNSGTSTKQEEKKNTTAGGWAF